MIFATDLGRPRLNGRLRAAQLFGNDLPREAGFLHLPKLPLLRRTTFDIPRIDRQPAWLN